MPLVEARENVHALAGVFVVCGLLSLLWMALSPPPAGRAGMTVLDGVAIAAGAGLKWRTPGVSSRTVHCALAAATLMISASAFMSGVPYAAGYFYLVALPYAFVFSARVAFAQGVLLAVTFAAALTAQALTVRHPLTAGAYATWWLVVITAVVSVGLLVRRLTSSLGSAQRTLLDGFRHASSGMAAIAADGRWAMVNDALCEILGRPQAQLVGRPADEVVHPDDAGVEPSTYVFERRYMRPSGEVVLTRVRSSVARDAHVGGTYRFLQVEDITERERARREAERRSAQQAAVARLGRVALVERDLTKLFVDSGEAVRVTLGVPFAGLLRVMPDSSLRRIAGGGWGPDVQAPAEARSSMAPYTLEVGEPVVVTDIASESRFDTAFLRSHGVVSGATVPVSGADDGYFGVLGAHSYEPNAFNADDIAFLEAIANVLTAAIRRDAAERRQLHASLHDPLTHLPNRALLVERLREAMGRARRDGTHIAVLFLDVDDFKHVNDTLGHDAGDLLLQTLAPRLADALRETDMLARFGGDEFCVVCEGFSEPREPLAVAERLLEAGAAPVRIGDADFHPSVSIGAAIAPPSYTADPETLLRDADVAMYRAKASGKQRVELFDAAMRAETLEHVELTNELRRAIEAHELELVYQPLVSLPEARIVAAEALLRWTSRTRGPISPAQFIPLAEESGLIVPIGSWVIDRALRDAANWPSPLRVGVNVSRRQLCHGQLVADVRDALERYGVDPARIVIEVTESALMEDTAVAGETLAALKGLGVQISLDDFGTGHSSLSSLRDFPLDALKLDRAFVTSLASDSNDVAIIRAVVDMARSLRLRSVAEGIEVEAQARLLTEIGCDLGQGFLFSRPIPRRDFEALLDRDSPVLPA